MDDELAGAIRRAKVKAGLDPNRKYVIRAWWDFLEPDYRESLSRAVVPLYLANIEGETPTVL